MHPYVSSGLDPHILEHLPVLTMFYKSGTCRAFRHTKALLWWEPGGFQ